MKTKNYFKESRGKKRHMTKTGAKQSKTKITAKSYLKPGKLQGQEHVVPYLYFCKKKLPTLKSILSENMF